MGVIMLQKLNKKKEIEAEAVRKMPLEQCDFELMVCAIHSEVHKKGGKVVVSGMGKAGQVAHNLATTLSSTGTPAVYLHPGEAQHGDLGLIQRNDVLILISNSGRTKEVLELLDLSRHRFSTITVYGIIGDTSSPLAEKVLGFLTTGNPPEICPLGLTPTVSTTCMMVLGDLLVVSLMERIGLTRKEYATCHHSGYLGQRAKGNVD
jgi:arabinose-5-phosphate isomerase